MGTCGIPGCLLCEVKQAKQKEATLLQRIIAWLKDESGGAIQR